MLSENGWPRDIKKQTLPHLTLLDLCKGFRAFQIFSFFDKIRNLFAISFEQMHKSSNVNRRGVQLLTPSRVLGISYFYNISELFVFFKMFCRCRKQQTLRF